MKQFQGRVVAPGSVTAEALVSHGGLNTLASFQKALQFGDKKATCGDQNNPDLYGRPMAGKALCLPQTIGSTTGGPCALLCLLHGPPARLYALFPADRFAGRRRRHSGRRLAGERLDAGDRLAGRGIPRLCKDRHDDPRGGFGLGFGGINAKTRTFTQNAHTLTHLLRKTEKSKNG